MKLERIDATCVRIPQTGQMKVEGRVFLDRRLESQLDGTEALQQVANVACLPGIVGASMAMPDIHWGYGFPIGGVAAFDVGDGVVSPGGVGYDINCGVRLVRSGLYRQDMESRIRDLVTALFLQVPTGVGSRRGDLCLTRDDMAEVCTEGAVWAVAQGYGRPDDLVCTEDEGAIAGADYSVISAKSFERGRDQLGTLGSGNHFVEVGFVAEVYDQAAAQVLGLELDQLVFTIHTGSRGFGYQVCSEAIDSLMGVSRKHGITLPDKQLVCAPVSSTEGKNYLKAMAAAANYAFANRQMITHTLRRSIAGVMQTHPDKLGLDVVWDVAHNIAKIEDHTVEGKRRRLCVHRKGATRSLPPGHPLLPQRYRGVGQPVLIPGDMGRYSYVAVGGPKAMEKSFGSCAHGAGRLLGRNQALKATKGRRIDEELAHRGIVVKASGGQTLREEFSGAYKDVAHVMRVVEKAGLAVPVARLEPLGVVKG